MKVNIVLDLAGTSDVQMCVDADDYVACMTAPTNTNFIAPAVSAPVAAMVAAQIGLCKTSITNLRTAIAAPISATKTDNMRTTRAALDSNVTMLANLVENIANSPTVLDANREGIVHSAGMKLKTFTSRGKAEFDVTNNKENGSVHVTAEGKVNAHLWEYTSDTEKFTNRVAAEATTAAHTDITGLTVGDYYAFFHKPVTPNGPHPWEGPIFITVT